MRGVDIKLPNKPALLYIGANSNIYVYLDIMPLSTLLYKQSSPTMTKDQVAPIISKALCRLSSSKG